MELGSFTQAPTPKCDLLVFTDESNSVAFNHLGIHYSDYAHRVPFHVKHQNFTEEATLRQTLNVAITVDKTRYFMNSTVFERNVINIRLNSEEFKLFKANLLPSY
ncbi:hypothetical protein BC833DRAFT_570414 [Globomyces pollinis-pini]|nr:hypothetical protein BC833DRAFT_570414 [Globomyces pollinis-pini]KAJ2990761.1 hypothetical protein HDV02_004173 [Globomyces sp. JEL0801]